MNPGRQAGRQDVRVEQDLMQRWSGGSRLEFPLKASSDKEQDTRRDGRPDGGNIGAHTKPHTMGV